MTETQLLVLNWELGNRNYWTEKHVARKNNVDETDETELHEHDAMHYVNDLNVPVL